MLLYLIFMSTNNIKANKEYTTFLKTEIGVWFLKCAR